LALGNWLMDASEKHKSTINNQGGGTRTPSANLIWLTHRSAFFLCLSLLPWTMSDDCCNSCKNDGLLLEMHEITVNYYYVLCCPLFLLEAGIWPFSCDRPTISICILGSDPAGIAEAAAEFWFSVDDDASQI
jgi:hypothetical protein